MDEHIRFVVVLMTMGLLLARCYSLGSDCNNKGDAGICTLVSKCPSAIRAIKVNHGHDYFRCGFQVDMEIVCCPLSEVSTTKKPSKDDDSEEEPSVRGTRIKKISQEQCEKYSKNLTIVLSFHIVDGEDAKQGEFPHMVALGFYNVAEKEYRFDCGGTLISHNYVLTAAHCIVQRNELKIARVGVVDVPETIQKPDWKIDYNVINITVHQEYDIRKKFNDIALVKLEKRIDFTNDIRPACLYTKEDDPPVMIVTGWGAISLGGNRSTRLQKANLNPIPIQECNNTYTSRTSRFVTPRQLCAADETSDACQGDSGGPLQIQTNTSIYTVVGVISYGIGCGSRHAGVYTRVNSYLDWIEKIVWPSS